MECSVEPEAQARGSMSGFWLKYRNVADIAEPTQLRRTNYSQACFRSTSFMEAVCLPAKPQMLVCVHQISIAGKRHVQQQLLTCKALRCPGCTKAQAVLSVRQATFMTPSWFSRLAVASASVSLPRDQSLRSMLMGRGVSTGTTAKSMKRCHMFCRTGQKPQGCDGGIHAS